MTPIDIETGKKEEVASPRDLLLFPSHGSLDKAGVDFAKRTHERFLAALEAELSELVQSPVSTQPREAWQSQLSSILDSASEKHLMTVGLEPLRGCAVLAFSPALLTAVLDILLDTQFRPEEAGHKVTGIEFHILRDFFDVILRCLRNAWRPAYPVAFAPASSGNEEAIQKAIDFTDDTTLTMESSIGVNGRTATFGLTIPSMLVRLASLVSNENQAAESAPEPVRHSIVNVLARSSVRLEGVLLGSEIRIRDLMELQPGHLLLLDSPVGTEFDCVINGKSSFKGELLGQRNRYSFQVTRMVPESSTSSN